MKHRKYAYSSKTLLMNTLNSGRINPLPSSKSYNRIPQSKAMHILPRGHIVTDPSTFSRISIVKSSGYFGHYVTLC